MAGGTQRPHRSLLPAKLCPELNPDERLNADMKHAISTKVPVRTKAKLKAASEEHMGLIGQSPDRVRAYFQDPPVKYAA